MADTPGWRGRKAIIRYGMPGHEYEFCINIEGYELTGEWIPASLSNALQEALGMPLGMQLLNRSSRLEIVVGPEREQQIADKLTEIGLVVVGSDDFPW